MDNWRAEFPALEKSVYMVSHSLGAMPRKAYEDLRAFADLWVNQGINAWHEWLPEVDRAAARIARIIGAPPGSMVMATNVSQIQALVASCLEYKERNKVVYSDMNFPSVSYVWQEERRRGADVVVVPSEDGIHPPMERLLEAIDERTLIVPISHVLFRSSAIKDVPAIVARAREVGAMVLLDCYQATGTVPFNVVDLGVDFACGGSVKWLCGGPGAAYLYVRPDRVAQFRPRNTGWFGHEEPFAFTMPEQHYATGVWRYMAGTPAVAALYQARAGAEIIAEIGVDKIRAQSLRQTARLVELLDEAGFPVGCPREPERRGGTVVVQVPESKRVIRELAARGVICDWRPDVGLRLGPHFFNVDDELRFAVEQIVELSGRGARSAAGRS